MPTLTDTAHDVLLHALAYEKRGWSVVPIEKGSKKSIVSWKAYQATRAPAELVRSWFEHQFTGAGVGIVTGQVSGIVVVDIDAPDDADFDIADHGGLPDTPSVRTAKGIHYYFQHPGASINGRLPWGDLKGDGGYVLAPPTIHPDTHKPYIWQVTPRDYPLAPLPEWIAALCERSVPDNGNGDGPKVAPPVDEAIPAGRRNGTLTSLAGSLRRRGLTAEEMYPALQAVNAARCHPPLEDTEVWLIAQSTARYAPEQSVFVPGNVDADEARVLNALSTTDCGNAEALVRLYTGQMLFDHTAQRWLIWQGHRWGVDRDGEAVQRGKTIARQRLGAAAQEGDGEKRKTLTKWAVASESRHRVDSALAMARTEAALKTTGERLDADPWLLGCANGVLDLRTGDLRPGEPGQLVTISTNLEYDPLAPCPRWESFLIEIFRGDMELIRFVRRAVGYTLTGSIREQCLFLCHGTGANGKSVFLSVLNGLLGEYATNTDFSTFLDNFGQSGSAATPDLVALKGARLVTASEVKEDRRWNEARLKSLTGGDSVTGRPLYGQPMTFTPTFKLWLAVNHRPRVSDNGPAIWRRIHLLPFTVRFGPDEADPDLPGKLKSELPGILAWGVAGCLGWQADGLTPPEVVRTATKGYRDEQDIIGCFLDACCVQGEGKEVSVASLYRVYRKWCEDSGEKPLSSIALGQRLGEQFTRVHTRTGNGYRGLGLVDSGERGPLL